MKKERKYKNKREEERMKIQSEEKTRKKTKQKERMIKKVGRKGKEPKQEIIREKTSSQVYSYLLQFCLQPNTLIHCWLVVKPSKSSLPVVNTGSTILTLSYCNYGIFLIISTYLSQT